MTFPYLKEAWCNRPYSIKQYLPSRTAIVLISVENYKKHEARRAEAMAMATKTVLPEPMIK